MSDLETAKEVFATKRLDLTKGFNLFLQNIATKKEPPILTEEELFLRLQKEIQENQQAIEAGRGIGLERVKEKYGIWVLSRDTYIGSWDEIGRFFLNVSWVLLNRFGKQIDSPHLTRGYVIGKDYIVYRVVKNEVRVGHLFATKSDYVKLLK